MPLYLYSINIAGAAIARHRARAQRRLESRRVHLHDASTTTLHSSLPDRDRTVISRSMLHVLDETRSIVAQAVCKLANFRRVARYQKRPTFPSRLPPPLPAPPRHGGETWELISPRRHFTLVLQRRALPTVLLPLSSLNISAALKRSPLSSPPIPLPRGLVSPWAIYTQWP